MSGDVNVLPEVEISVNSLQLLSCAAATTAGWAKVSQGQVTCMQSRGESEFHAAGTILLTIVKSIHLISLQT